MVDPDGELAAEIEAFRAELRMRAEAHRRESRHASPLDLPVVDIGSLTLPEARALIAERYRYARLEHRLEMVEQRLSEIEGRHGRA